MKQLHLLTCIWSIRFPLPDHRRCMCGRNFACVAISIHFSYRYLNWNIYRRQNVNDVHYNDVIMGAISSQITSLTIVYSTVYLRRSSNKTSKLRVTGLCEGGSLVTGEFPAQRASDAENVSMWWRHHENQPYSTKQHVHNHIGTGDSVGGHQRSL